MTQRLEISWRVAPFIRLLFPLIMGMVAAWWFPSFVAQTYVLVGLVLFLVAGFFLLPKGVQISNRNLIGLGIFLWLLVFGYWRGQDYQQGWQEKHFSQTTDFSVDSSYYWLAEVADIRPGNERLRITVDVSNQSYSIQDSAPVKGRLLIYLPADSNSQHLLPGQVVAFYGQAKTLQLPKNPDGFNFADWQAKRNVFHQLRLDATAWSWVDKEPSLLGRALLVRESLLHVLYTYLPTGSNELAVAAALILGKRDELSTDLRNAYAETGAIHVLAVSGLHVGLVAGGLAWLLSWGFLQRRQWRWLRLVVILSGIWTFAFITGLSPSVMRAAVMFSFLQFGSALGEQSNSYNTLAASAFLLLLINPLLVFDIGFQLSYLAVAGILFFQPRIYKLWYSPYRLIDGAWQLSAVAIAAQLVTFPLSIYYFHQFPLYFLLSGLVVVISASFILYLGIFLFAAHYLIPILATLFAWLLHGLLFVNNAVIYYIKSLPGHLLEGIWIGEGILVLLYLMLFLFLFYLISRRAHWLLATIASLCLALGANLWQQSKLSQQRRIIVYQEYKATLADFFDGRLRYTIGTIPDDDPRLSWDVAPHRDKRGIRYDQADSLSTLHWYQSGEVIGFHDKSLVWINDSLQLDIPPVQPLEIDLALVSDSPYLTLAELSKHYKADTWIFDGSNYPSRVRDWMAEAESLQLKTHWTTEQGYFAIDF